MRRPGSMTRLLLRSALRRPVTTTYPAVRLQTPDRFRGRLAFQPALCIGCRLCTRDCPTGAIEIRKVGDKEFTAEIDFSRCIYCAQCVDVCPKKALAATGDFELAQLRRGALKILFGAGPREVPPPAPPASEAPQGAAPPKASGPRAATDSTPDAAPDSTPPDSDCQPARKRPPSPTGSR